MRRPCRAALLGLLLVTAGCRQAPAPTSASSTAGPTAAASPAAAEVEHGLPAGIDWFTGGVESALAESLKSGKPVMLYWGAVWCPPCHQLKATVFSRKDFQQKLQHFIPVYLDGDEPGAQKWGETFGVSGYPSVVILNGDRSEILRIAGGMDLNQYATMLDAALEDRRPARAVLAKLARIGTHGTAEECHRVAWQAWSLEDLEPAARVQRGARLTAAAQACAQRPADERTRLAVFGAADLASGKTPLSPRTVAQIGGLLADRNAAAAQMDALRTLAADYFRALARTDGKAAQAQLQHYLAAMRQAADSDAYVRGDQLNALYSALVASRSLSSDDQPAPELAAVARERVSQALREPTPAAEHSSVINGVLNVLDGLHDDAQAFEINLREAERSPSPYYYLGTLGDLAESMGRGEEALSWHAKAYASARGAATRFQWGSDYLLAVLRLAPDDSERVRETGFAVLGELDAPDAIYRRSRTRLLKLDAALRDWAKSDPARQAAATALRSRMSDTCGKLPADDPASATCRAFVRG
jgi:protein disulfide-isomerase